MSRPRGAARPGHYNDVVRAHRVRDAGERRHALSAGGGGGGDPGIDPPDAGDDEEQPVPPARARQQRTITRSLVPTGLDTFPWATSFVNEARDNLRRYAIWAFFAILFMLILWLAGAVPGVQMATLRYGAFWFFFQFPFYLLNVIIAGWSTVTEFYIAGGFLFLFAFAAEVYLTTVLSLNFVYCIRGVYPSSCANNYRIDIFVAVPTLILVVVGLLTVLDYAFIVLRTGNTQQAVVIEKSRI